MVILIAYGGIMAALVGFGGAAIVYEEYRRGLPSLVAGLAMFAALPWFIGLFI